MRTIFQSLRARLSFWVMALSVGIFALIAYVFHIYSFEREEDQAKQYTHAMLDNMAMRLDMRIQAVEHTLRQSVPLIEANLQHPERMADIVQQWVVGDTLIMGGSIAFEPDYFPRHGRYFMEYAYIDPSGNVNHKRLGGTDYDYFFKDWYRKAKDTGHDAWSEPYFDRGGGQTYMATYSLPLKDKAGRVYAVATADVSLADLTEAVHSLQLYPDSRILMCTERGTFLTHWEKDLVCKSNINLYAASLGHKDAYKIAAEIGAGHRGTMKITMQGRDALAFYTVVPDVGWRLCAFCTYQSIMGELFSTTVTIISIILTGLIVLVFCIQLILRREMEPLENLARTARKIGRGEFNAPLPSVEGNDELRQLRDSFATMQQSLADYIKELTATTASKQRIESELHIAHALQMSLIPNIFPPFPERKELDLYASLKPAKEVGGDLYDFIIRDEKLYFAVGDVSGKGIPASLFMAITRSLYRMVAGNEDSPAAIAKMLNAAIADDNASNMFITMFIGVLDLATGHLTFCNAGHNPPLLIPTQGGCHFMQTLPNLPIGIVEAFDYKEQDTQLGDCGLLVYTDGVTEAEGPQHALYGEQRLVDTCDKLCGCASTTIVTSLADAVAKHAADAEQSDDITMLLVKLKKEA